MELSLREEKLIQYAMSQAADQLETVLLINVAELEERVCLLELGITNEDEEVK